MTFLESGENYFIGRRNVHEKNSLHIISGSLWSLGTLTQL